MKKIRTIAVLFNLTMRVQEREDFIAKVNGKREFPWRVFIVTTKDKQLAVSDMTYKLASPSRVADTSWIKPGKVAWEWWYNWNIYGVDFEAGINNDTYKYYIDFASKHDIEYVILDEGWVVNLKADLMQIVPEIDLSFLPEGNYKMTLFRDGANAHRKGIDYVKESRQAHSGEKLTVHQAPGGGFAIKMEKM